MSCTGEKKRQSDVLAQASRIAGAQVGGAALCLYPGCNRPLNAAQECPAGHSQCPGDVAQALLAAAQNAYGAWSGSGTFNSARFAELGQALQRAQLARSVYLEQGDTEAAGQADSLIAQLGNADAVAEPVAGFRRRAAAALEAMRARRLTGEEAHNVLGQLERAAEGLGDHATLAAVYHRRGDLAAGNEDWAGATKQLAQAAEHATLTGDLALEAAAWGELGGAHAARGSRHQDEGDNTAYRAAMGEAGKCLLRAADAAQRAGDLAEAFGLVSRAERYCGGVGAWEEYDQAKAQERAILQAQGRFRELAEELRREAFSAESGEDVAAARAWRRQQAAAWAQEGARCRREGHIEESVAAYQERYAAASKAGEQDEVVRALHDVGNIATLAGHAALARTAAAEALKIIAPLGNHELRAKTLVMAGAVAYLDGDLARAEVLYQEASEMAWSRGDTLVQAQAQASLGGVYRELGDAEAAAGAFRQCGTLLAEHTERDALLARGLAFVELGRLLGNPDSGGEAGQVWQQARETLLQVPGLDEAMVDLMTMPGPAPSVAEQAAAMGWERPKKSAGKRGRDRATRQGDEA